MSTRSPFASTAMMCSLVFLGCGGPVHTASAPAITSAPTVASPGEEPAPTATALTEAARSLAGTWDCSGSVVGPEGSSPSQVTFNAGLVLDDTWLQTEFVVISGRYPYEFRANRTYVASSGTWVNLIIDNLGGHSVSRSADGITWTGTSSSPMGEMTIRDSETVLSPGEMTMLGEYSLDGGAAWNTGYELSCERRSG